MGIHIHHNKLADLREKIISRKKQIERLSDTTGQAKKIFEDYIQPIMNIYQPIISPLASHNTNLFYRARKCLDDEPFSHVKDLYNPPNPSGRAFSSVSKPTLYGSSSMQTSLAEIEVKIGDLVNIAIFDYTQIMKDDFWFVGQLGIFYKSQEETRYLENVSILHKLFNNEEDVLISLVFKDLLINEIFSTLSSDEDRYELNQFLIENIENSISKDRRFNGVLFISTKDAPGVNFAIYGEAIKDLKLSKVNLIKITSIDDYGCIGYKHLQSLSSKDGNLNWNKNI
ncbi:RES domain-containing protein [Sulfurimonas sp.]|uniref:RES domain-containing protein n=1 Tax=Sulfurimonas sp. TaxID=2022749 RepID=UPI0025E01CBE|nr:RES domain-containing protein [Sulfurimonas sp.]